MPVEKSLPYKCPRCGYTTRYRSSMIDHLNRKNPCPTTVSDIKLTSELKSRVLNNRSLSLQATTRIVNQQNATIIINNTYTDNSTHNHYNMVTQQYFSKQPFIHNLDYYAKMKNIPIETVNNRAKIACADEKWIQTDMQKDEIIDGHHVIKKETCKKLFNSMSTRPTDKVAFYRHYKTT